MGWRLGGDGEGEVRKREVRQGKGVETSYWHHVGNCRLTGLSAIDTIVPSMQIPL